MPHVLDTKRQVPQLKSQPSSCQAIVWPVACVKSMIFRVAGLFPVLAANQLISCFMMFHVVSEILF